MKRSEARSVENDELLKQTGIDLIELSNIVLLVVVTFNLSLIS